MHRRHPVVVVVARYLCLPFLVLLAGLLPAGPARAVTVPSGFQEVVAFSGLVNPTVVRFAADGRIFVAEKSGLIKVFDGLTDATPTIFADLRTNVHNFWDRGLLGLALDPGFPTNPYIYVLYTHDAAIGGTAPRWGTAGASSDPCPSPPGPTGDGCVVSGRLSRLPAAGNVMTGPEQVLIEDWCQQYPSHSVGSLTFGADGALYVSAGDGASFNFADYGQDGSPVNPCGDPPGGVGGAMAPPSAQGGALRSQDLRTAGDPVTLDGTIVRVNPATGAAMPGNPLIGNSDLNARRIVAYGLRNPFRIVNRPGTNEIWIGDVGWNIWEEINRIPNPTDGTVRNFGWPCYEGNVRQSGYDSANLTICEELYTTPSAHTPPFFTYSHSSTVIPGESCPTGSSSIAGMVFDFYPGGTYPAEYDGALFFADYSRDCIWAIPRGTNGLPDVSRIVTFVAQAANPVDVQFGPGGDLYYADFDGGTIRRVRYLGANRPPVAVAEANPASGAAPLAVSFDGRGSSDPDPGDTLSYDWDLDGDGAFGDSSSATPSRTYPPGTYNVTLRATDPLGASGTAAVTVNASNTPPTASITTPAAGTLWRVGDQINFAGSASDAQDGTLPPAALSWTLLLQHCPSNCHTHTVQTFTGASGSFTAPDHEYPSYLELRLTATDAHGASDVETLRLDPRTVALAFESSPGGLQLVVGGTSQAAPFSREVILGSTSSVSAPSPQSLGPDGYTFATWSDGGAQSHNVVAEAAATYRATFDRAATAAAALTFDGVNDHVRVNDTAALRLTTSLTAEAWVKPTAASGHRHIVGKNNWELSIEPSGTGFRALFEFSSGGSWRSIASGQFPLNQWYHVAGTYDGAAMRLFVNGVQVATQAGGGAIDQTANPLRIGSADAQGDYFVGRIDEVRVSRVARYSASFAVPQAAFAPDVSTVGLWHLDEGSGLTTADASGNNHAGTLTNGPVWTTDTPLGPRDANPPTASMTAPAGGTTVSGTVVNVAATAADDVGVVGVQFLLDGAPLGSVDTSVPYAITWNSTTATNGTHTLGARATDAAGNVGNATAVTVTVSNVDSTAPTISAVAASNVTTSGATVTWTTNEPSTSRVDYGTTTAYGSSTPTDNSLVTGHSRTLTGLAPSTLYHYRVVSRDASGNEALSADATFTTAGPGARTLIGQSAIGTNVDSNPAGMAEAFQSTATGTGTADRIHVYLDAGSTATRVVVGIYTNNAANNPGTLLAQATINAPVNGAWNTVVLPPTGLSAGTVYWVALLGPTGAGTAQFRDGASGGRAQTSSQSNLTTLPTTWSPGVNYSNSPLSAHLTEGG
jgi:glucose/arabinose dehydrogenase